MKTSKMIEMLQESLDQDGDMEIKVYNSCRLKEGFLEGDDLALCRQCDDEDNPYEILITDKETASGLD